MLSFIRRLFERQPDTARVASLILKELQKRSPGEAFSLDSEQYLIRRADGGVIYLNNLYRDYCRAKPSERKDQIERFVLGMLNADRPDELKATHPRLLPILRHLGGVDLARISNGDLSLPLEEAMLWRQFSPVLGAAVAVDSDHAIAQVSQLDLEKWGITFEEAFAIAVDNLRHKAAPTFSEIGPGLYASNYGDYYDAGRIFLHELAWQLPLNGDPVAMVPNRTCLLICGANDPAALVEMVNQARLVLREQSRPLSSEMFRLVDKDWSLWTPAGEAGALLNTLQREDRAGDYAEQQAALEKMHEDAGIDVFVAKHTLIQRSTDGALLSYAVLPKDVDTWLPECDLVVLSEAQGGASTIVSWSDFIEHARHLIERLPFAVPRWKVLGFPERDCLEKLREVATTMDAAKV